MKILPKIENEERCSSLWERLVMYRIESSAKNRTTYWVMAIMWTLLWVLMSLDGDTPIFASILFAMSWMAVAESYSSGTLLKIFTRKSTSSTGDQI
jgi:hypothetical protein